jgi:hypothetical protein
MSKTEDPMIAALLRERAGYVQFGKKDRVKAVDAELERLGWEDPEKAKPEPEKQEPKGRAGRESRQTTADDAKPKATG